MINDKAILVGVDGSHASYKATWWAANYAKHAGLTLQIVCAYSLPSYAAVSFDATYTAMGDDNAAHSDAQEILSKAKAIATTTSSLSATAAREAWLSVCWAPRLRRCRHMHTARLWWCRTPMMTVT